MRESLADEIGFRKKHGVRQVAYASDAVRERMIRKGLWQARRRVTEVIAPSDPLDLKVTSLVFTEAIGGPIGTFRAEALSCIHPMVAFEWRYTLRGDDEVWTLSAMRRDAESRVYCAEVVYSPEGTIFDNISRDDEMVRAFKWLMHDIARGSGATPNWIGSFTSSANQYSLITKDGCVPCDTPFCNCE
jgi:hypothetical protein